MSFIVLLILVDKIIWSVIISPCFKTGAMAKALRILKGKGGRLLSNRHNKAASTKAAISTKGDASKVDRGRLKNREKN